MNLTSKEIWFKKFDQSVLFDSYLFSIWLIVAIIFTIFLIYTILLKKTKPGAVPCLFVILVQMYIGMIRSLVVEMLGKKSEKLTPYFLFLFSYILLSNTIGILGFKNPTALYLVPLSMGIITWLGIFVFGFKYQRLSYLKTYCFCVKIKNKSIPILINPIEVFSSIAPLISISFRLWGNIFAGETIVSLWFYFTSSLFGSIPVLNTLNILAGLTAWPIHIYFDLLCGLIQTFVFFILTVVYWSMAKGEQEEIAPQVAIEPKINKN